MKDEIREAFEKAEKKSMAFSQGYRSAQAEITHLKALIDYQVKGHDEQRAEIQELKKHIKDLESKLEWGW